MLDDAQCVYGCASPGGGGAVKKVLLCHRVALEGVGGCNKQQAMLEAGHSASSDVKRCAHYNFAPPIGVHKFKLIQLSFANVRAKAATLQYAFGSKQAGPLWAGLVHCGLV